MTHTLDAVYKGGMLRPVLPLDLPEDTHVRIVLVTNDPAEAITADDDEVDDPFDAIRTDTGIPDLAERFDDYRFGRKTVE